MSDTKQVNVRLEEDLLEMLRSRAKEMSDTLGCEVSLTDVIKGALNKEILNPGEKQKMDFEIEEKRYVPFSRKIFKPHYIDKSENPKYKRGLSSVSYVIPQRGSVPDMLIEAEEIDPQYFTIASNPTWKIVDDYPGYREKIIERAIDTLNNNEDKNMIILLNRTFGEINDNSNKYPEIPDQLLWKSKENFAGKYSIDNFNKGYKNAIAKLKAHAHSCGNILIHPAMRERASEYFDFESDNFVVNDSSEYIPGKTNINQSYMVPKNSVYTLARPENVGVATIKINEQILEANDPKLLRYGIVVFRYLALTLVNDYCVSKFEIID